MRRRRIVGSGRMTARPVRHTSSVDVAKSIATIVALADDACRELQRLRERLAHLPAPARAAEPLTDDWRIVEHGLFGPAGILGIIAAGVTANAFESTSDAFESPIGQNAGHRRGRGLMADRR